MIRINTVTLVLSLLLFMPAEAAGPEGHAVNDMRSDCDISTGPCRKTAGKDGPDVVFAAAPRPVVAMKEITLTVTLRENGQAVTDAAVAVDLSMPGMFMGENRPVLSHTVDGIYTGTGIFPKCPHGGSIWKADVEIARGGSISAARFVFEVK